MPIDLSSKGWQVENATVFELYQVGWYSGKPDMANCVTFRIEVDNNYARNVMKLEPNAYAERIAKRIARILNESEEDIMRA